MRAAARLSVPLLLSPPLENFHGCGESIRIKCLQTPLCVYDTFWFFCYAEQKEEASLDAGEASVIAPTVFEQQQFTASASAQAVRLVSCSTS